MVLAAGSQTKSTKPRPHPNRLTLELACADDAADLAGTAGALPAGMAIQSTLVHGAVGAGPRSASASWVGDGVEDGDGIAIVGVGRGLTVAVAVAVGIKDGVAAAAVQPASVAIAANPARVTATACRLEKSRVGCELIATNGPTVCPAPLTCSLPSMPLPWRQEDVRHLRL
jgi:hypothetical protein